MRTRTVVLVSVLLGSFIMPCAPAQSPGRVDSLAVGETATPDAATEGRLLVWADGLCRVSVDGVVVSTVAAGEWVLVRVRRGEHVVEAVGLGDAVVIDARTVQVGAEPGVIRVSVSGNGWAGRTLVFGAEQRVNPKDGLPYVWLPPGDLQMGCVPGDWECESDESPRHAVRLSRGFWMGKTEVTVAAFSRWTRPPDGNGGANEPVVYVDWDEASAFCGWSGGRLPTEAEWEYAARAGSPGDTYPWTGPATHEMANYHGVGGKDVWNGAAPVGSFPANRGWLYEMAGNVWEWSLDWYASDYYARSPSTDPAGPDSGAYRVLRGGSWNDYPRSLRASNRAMGAPDNRYFVTGFRCARDTPPS